MGMPKRPLLIMQKTISALKDLSNNLWWSWDTEAKQIFEDLSPLLWERNNHNPVELLRHISNEELAARCQCELGERILNVHSRFQDYLNSKETWALKDAPELTKNPVAYFSAEFGIHESVRIYSGASASLPVTTSNRPVTSASTSSASRCSTKRATSASTSTRMDGRWRTILCSMQKAFPLKK